MSAQTRSPPEESEYVLVELSEIRKEIQCPICLGIIKKTRTAIDCLHRFCRACIEKSIRLGNNECPACHKHCASGLSLRDDPKYDALIEALYPNIARCGEEELAFDDEDPNGNQQVVRFMELAVETYRCLPLCA
ncbi:putative E3 ubiquitin-protein ligase RING1a isoform X2 [Carica papaya]|uniref:putative E3 ubiquitin-protein ligase RING1a isoform X2 n=1 Tax=Carica papaya TaxID=3649 RepID=UPI000B8C700E|nr:putative E3 ubiquitin-protein ligase RING1a isoform X2 [Carica papaya]